MQLGEIYRASVGKTFKEAVDIGKVRYETIEHESS